MVYFVLGLALFSPAPYLEVMRHLVEGLRGQGLLGGWHVPAKSSLFRARQRLGCEPLRVLFATTAKPMATEATPGAFWRGLRLLAVDATCWDIADSEANEAAFGRPGNGRGPGKSAFPQVRMAALVEVGSHAVLDAELAGCRTGEVTLVGRLPRSLGPGRLVLADREFLGVPLWQAFTATGADLLWRVPANRVLPVTRRRRALCSACQAVGSSRPKEMRPVPRRPATAAAFGPSSAAMTNSIGSAVFTCAPVCRNRMSRTRSPSRYSVERPAHRSWSAAVKFSSLAAVVGRMPRVRRAVFPVPTPQMIRPGARALRLASPLAAAGAERSAGEVTPMPSLMRLVAFAHRLKATKGSPWTIGES
ncbi:IS4 family transposase [Streptomyces javensis]|uniref:IS4 family transposase n=1 Tax=Streptomyces javensis TaxID=114698 RepID=A0ABS0R287_9ACTN|nr:IS4 family transposase [Streptomyces javensis]